MFMSNSIQIRPLYLLLLWLLLACFRPAGGQENRPSFSFVQLCDPQLGMGGYARDSIHLKQAVRQINAMECDFVVVCGDLVHHASARSFRDFLEITQDLKMPLYLAAGNHDVGNAPSDSSLRYYRSMLGKDYYSFQHQGHAFVVTNTQLWKNPLAKESEQHHRWFTSELKHLAKEATPIVVIGHHPLFVTQAQEEEAYFNLPPETREEILALMTQAGVKAYLSGHKHETLVNEFRGIQLVTGESTSKNFDQRPLGFRLWEQGSDGLHHRFIPLNQSSALSPKQLHYTRQVDSTITQKTRH